MLHFGILVTQENGAAYDAGGLQVGQLILEVDGQKVEGKVWILLLLGAFDGFNTWL